MDESLRGYLTKYDCSSADINPIGISFSICSFRFFFSFSLTHSTLTHSLARSLTLSHSLSHIPFPSSLTRRGGIGKRDLKSFLCWAARDEFVNYPIMEEVSSLPSLSPSSLFITLTLSDCWCHADCRVRAHYRDVYTER